MNDDWTSKLLIHIGYHKTATTWLQKTLFSNEELGLKLLLPRKTIRNTLIIPHAFDFSAEENKELYYKEADPLIDSNITPVISHERLSGNPHSGGYDSKELADRLAKLFPKGKILIVFREQKGAILSSYKQYIKVGGTSNIKDYLRPPQIGRNRMPLFSFDYFKYDRLVNYYLNLFGTNNVLVLPFELFKEDPDEFCSKIIHFAGQNKTSKLPYKKVVNKGLSTFSSSIIRQLNKYFVKTTLNPNAIDFNGTQKKLFKPIKLIDKAIPKSVHKMLDKGLEKTVSEMSQSIYKDSNCKIAKMLNLDLARYGYDT